MIAAAGEDNSLGKDNDLLWHLPDDFKRFKHLTTGHPIIMGRKTYETFPKPLPNRTHIIITRDRDFKVEFEECVIVHSLPDALNLCRKEPLSYIIGGGEIYAQGEKFSNKIELTRVHASFEDADTFFPEIDLKNWELISEEYHPTDERHQYAFTYLTYMRKNSF